MKVCKHVDESFECKLDGIVCKFEDQKNCSNFEEQWDEIDEADLQLHFNREEKNKLHNT